MWDRGALTAVDPSLRVDYAWVLRGLLAPDARVLLVALDFDEGVVEPSDLIFGPHSVGVESLQVMFPCFCSRLLLYNILFFCQIFDQIFGHVVDQMLARILIRNTMYSSTGTGGLGFMRNFLLKHFFLKILGIFQNLRFV